MKVPYKWLLDFVDIDKNIHETADALTLSGSNVEEVIESGKDIDRVVTGKITKIEKHPDADKLIICMVDVKDEVLQIVTGADNVKVGDVVPVALHSSTLPGGVKIKRGKLRGVESNGMLCSETELGIATEESVHGIMILPPETPLGVDIKEVLGLNGGVIDFEITSNRSDCFSVYGIAREAAATFNKKLKPIEMKYKETDDINKYLSVEISDKLCRRYAAKMVKNIKIKPSPEWMQDRLKECGVRPINNIVDITNYVMMEIGQPMHAFDYRYIDSKHINVRRAKDDEEFITLDGNKRTLDNSMLVIADGDKAVAAAGVMGGENSEVMDDTTTVVFEFANFDGTNIRLTSKKLGLRTEASNKYEKNLDPNLIDMAINRACGLIEQIGAGDVVGGTIDIYPQKAEPKTVEVSCSWINRFLGTNIDKKDIKAYLERLQLKVEGDEILKLTVPTFRQDINIKEDVAEEVARIYGYNNIPTVKMFGETVEAVWTPEQKLLKILKNTMAASGLYESMTFSFTNKKMFDAIKLPKDSELRNAVVISNPLGEDFSLMKTTGIPAMLENLGRNYTRDNKEAKLFEISRVYIPGSEKLPEEKDKLVIGMIGKVDFFDLKGIIENALNAFHIDKYDFERETGNKTFHPGRCAQLNIRRKPAGILGQVHPSVAENFGIEDEAYIAEIDIKSIFDAANPDRAYKPLPKYPAVTRDLAMLIGEDIPVKEIENVIVKAGHELVESIKLFDVYKGKQVPDGLKSIAYSIVYRAENRTLKDEEVNKVHENIVKVIENKFGAQLR